MKFSTSDFLHSSNKLENPTRLLCIYSEGFSSEFLTPACAAKLITILERIYKKFLLMFLVTLIYP